MEPVSRVTTVTVCGDGVVGLEPSGPCHRVSSRGVRPAAEYRLLLGVSQTHVCYRPLTQFSLTSGGGAGFLHHTRAPTSLGCL